MPYKIKLFIIAVLTGVLFSISTANAEVEPATSSTIIEEIESGSEGRITIDIPPAILRLILDEPVKEAPTQEGPVLHHGVNKMSGYRIQVFSDGRNQHSLESRAKARGAAILAKFPKYRGQIYSYSESPNWYTRVGNFQTSGEASEALSELKRAFPGFASEMRVVKTQIIVIK
ncbi:MAG: SPOR domain-containing protein [Muribaculaceae bacterium]|nr:SPOR domain-containing protein [Muribaculaceae bacterium]